jgi:hypothetical protein
MQPIVLPKQFLLDLCQFIAHSKNSFIQSVNHQYVNHAHYRHRHRFVFTPRVQQSCFF